MKTSISLLILLNIIIPLSACYYGCLRKRGVEVNHIATFTIGYMFYWISPIAVASCNFFRQDPLTAPYYELFRQIQARTILHFLQFSLAYYLFFILGHHLSHRLRCRSMEYYGQLRFDRRLLAIYLFLGTTASLLLLFQLRAQLFKGYTISIYQIRNPLRGTYAGWCNFLLAVTIIYSMAGRTLINGYFCLTSVFFLLLLSLGGRSYMLTALFIYILYYSIFIKPLSLKSTFIFGLFVGIGGGFFAVMRQHVQFSTIVAIFAEPIYVSIALFYFLREDHFPLLRMPRVLIGDFLFMIPTFVLPNKEALIPRVADAGIPAFAPLGSLHSFLSLMANFGVIGSCLLALFIGFTMNLLKSAGQHTLLWQVIYTMLAAQLAFTFWRDDFAISIVKNMIEGSILIPMFIIASLSILTGLLGRRYSKRAV